MSDPEVRERIGGRSDLADLQAYRAPQIDAPIRLNTNETPYPPTPAFIQDLKDRLGSLPLNRYPDRNATKLREALAAHVGTITERVWVANGSNEILLQLMLAFGGQERRAMTFEPTYAMHGHIVRVSGTRLLRARRNPDYSLHIEASIEACTSQQPDIVFLCSPNNPTGGILIEDEVEAICRASPGLVVLDEAYAEFADSSLIRMVEDHDNLVVVRSFSKAWRLAGIRLGYLVAHNWVIDETLKVRLPYHLSELTQAAGLTAIAHAAELQSTVETIKHERDRLWRELSTTRGITAFPSQGNFILFRCDEVPAAQVWQKLLEGGVLIRDFSDMPGCEECLRVSIGTPEEDETFLEHLSMALGR